jgi:putative FmdB family regulatory protein
VPMYEYHCDCGGRVEVLAAAGAPAPACPACGGGTRKVVSMFAIGGRADPGLSRSQMPQTWKGTYGGNPEYTTHLQRLWEQRRRLEDRYPELAGDGRPIVAHEGFYSAVPLRAGDPWAPRAVDAGAKPEGGSGAAADASGKGFVGEDRHHAHPHGHLHTHPARPHPSTA